MLTKTNLLCGLSNDANMDNVMLAEKKMLANAKVLLTRQLFYLNDGVKRGNSRHTIMAVEAIACLRHQPLNLI